MHNYATENLKIEKIHFWLAIISYIVAPYLAQALSVLLKVIFGENADITASNLGFSVSSILLFTILNYIFTRFIWKIPCINKWLNIPDISGIWVCSGLGYKYEDKTQKNVWKGQIEIKQTLSKMSVVLTTDESKSRSTSIVSGISEENSSLVYIYRNDPLNKSNDMYSHEGLCKIIFNLNDGTASGTYYTSPERKSYGEMQLKKI